MPYTPPFRTRRSTQRQVEPHLGNPDTDTPEKTLTWTTATNRTLADDPTPVSPPVQDDDDEDALPVLTQLVEPPVAPTPLATRLLEPPEEPVLEGPLAEEPVDEELVARITDEVLDALQPALQDIVGEAVRQALQDYRSRRGNI